MASEQSSLPPISFPQIPPTHRHCKWFSSDFIFFSPFGCSAISSASVSFIYAQPKPCLAFWPLRFSTNITPPRTLSHFLSHYLSPQPLGSNQQYLSAISHMWFAHFHLCILLHANPPPTDLQIHFFSFHQYHASLQNSVHHLFLQKFLVTQLQPSTGFLLSFIL